MPLTRQAARRARTVGFTTLPTELRFMVWRETFVRRTLHINAEVIRLPFPPRPPGHKGRMKSAPRPHHIRFSSTERPPVALQVCRESRTVALEHYKPAFHSVTFPPHREDVKKTAIYFNPELDVVHIVDPYHDTVRKTLSRNEETVRQIKVLAIAGCVRVRTQLQPVAHRMPYLWSDLRLYEKLEEIIFVVEGQLARSLDVIREDVEANLCEFRDLLQAQGEPWRVPVVTVCAQLE